MKCSDNANLNVLERNVMTRAEKYGDDLSQLGRSVPNLVDFRVATQQYLMHMLFIRVTHKLLSTAIYVSHIRRGAPIIRGWYDRPIVAAVPKVPPHKLKRKEVNHKHNFNFYINTVSQTM
jgi:hypothetical protein